MSLYQLQKFLFDINRDRDLQRQCRADLPAVLDRYDLSGEERGALEAGDIGLIYVLGANGQLLMHYAAFLPLPGARHLAAMPARLRPAAPVPAPLPPPHTPLHPQIAPLP